MRFLIAIGSREFSEPTLRVGMQVAKGFGASVTICYVGPRISQFTAHEVRLAQETLERWEFDRPGVEVLEWAFHFLAENGYITPQTVQAGFQRNMLVETGGTRSELYLPGTFCKDVNLILRNGEIIAELRDEVRQEGYAVVIIGGSQKRRMAHDLVQYIDSSILVVKNFNPEQRYRLLLAVDDSKGTRKAVNYGARVAQAFGMPVDILTVSKKDYFGPGYRGAAAWAAEFLRRAGIEYESWFKVGDPPQVIREMAGKDHIIVMGVSTMSPLKKFFVGSKPQKVMEECQCTVLIVK
jgi:nucleotide-binding universal stress UspA family protein